MYAIIVYDIKVKRVSKVCKYLRRHLTWVQNSVFEGKVTKAGLAKIKFGLSQIVDEEEDSIIFFVMSSPKWIDRTIMGIDKGRISNLL